MSTTLILSNFSSLARRLLCRWREARRLRRDLQELGAMSACELTDLGISHASVGAMKPSGCCA
ncbi:MAG: DUF1127 domain-containing protein [Burkholderiales bacterium]|nr:DUF1127 domain-containing protein [Burkholderiales bacterium]